MTGSLDKQIDNSNALGVREERNEDGGTKPFYILELIMMIYSIFSGLSSSPSDTLFTICFFSHVN